MLLLVCASDSIPNSSLFVKNELRHEPRGYAKVITEIRNSLEILTLCAPLVYAVGTTAYWGSTRNVSIEQEPKLLKFVKKCQGVASAEPS